MQLVHTITSVILLSFSNPSNLNMMSSPASPVLIFQERFGIRLQCRLRKYNIP